jgi:hypothetical protein
MFKLSHFLRTFSVHPRRGVRVQPRCRRGADERLRRPDPEVQEAGGNRI